MIYTQDRSSIVRIGKRLYILQIGDMYHIMNKNNDNDVDDLGEYEKKNDAEEILKTIFQFLRGKKDSYCMPKLNEMIKIV